MRPQNDFNIEFSGLKLGHHNFDFDISTFEPKDYSIDSPILEIYILE